MRVAVGLVRNPEGRYLITQRPPGTSHEGYWEFPGGKLEENEMPVQALVRELFEEVGLEIINAAYVGQVSHDYGDRTVELEIFLVEQFQGEPCCKEGQTGMLWLSLNDIDSYQFPAANQAIIKLIQSQ